MGQPSAIGASQSVDFGLRASYWSVPVPSARYTPTPPFWFHLPLIRKDADS